MKTRWLAVIGTAAVLGVVGTFFASPQSSVSATNGRATPMDASQEMFMVTMDLQNDGAPVSIESVRSPSGATVSLMNSNGSGAMVVPGNDTAQLAADGAHVVLHIEPTAFPEGSYQSLSLGMSDGSEVVVRILHPVPTNLAPRMDHGMNNGIDMSPSPKISLSREPDVKPEGFEVEITVEDFEFAVVEDGSPHVDGQGHGHVYLNGVKLGRLYETRFDVGALPAGDYVLVVALNSNDHRPYISDGAQVAVTYEFSL